MHVLIRHIPIMSYQIEEMKLATQIDNKNPLLHGYSTFWLSPVGLGDSYDKHLVIKQEIQCFYSIWDLPNKEQVSTRYILATIFIILYCKLKKS